MTTPSAVASKVLPVSILTGPSTRTLIKDIVASDPDCRFGVLAGAEAAGMQTIGEGVMVEELQTSSHGGYDPAQIGSQIATLAGKGLIDHLLLECDSQTHPIAFASLFLPPDGGGQGLSELARLSSIVLAIDSATVLGSFVQGIPIPGLPSSCILADQMEVASLVVLSGDLPDENLARAQAIISAINPRARVVQRSQKVGKLLDSSISFDFAAASEGAGWRKIIEAESNARTTEQNVTTFAYHSRRPFHPQRFWNLLHGGFPGVFRAKGYFWLATRMDLVGGLNLAGSDHYCAPAGEWWAAVAQKDGSGHREIPDRLQKVWREPFGDRRQAIAFMGIDLTPANLVAQLDACLLDDSEMAAGESSWASLPDPFPSWSPHSHDHECEDEDCCHHH
jgi:G3E family GTPase